MKKQADSTIGSMIKSKRKTLKLTQKELADLIGKSLRTVQGYENNTINISLPVLNQIAEALHCSTYDFLDEESKKAIDELVDGGFLDETIEPLGVSRVYVGKKSRILLQTFETLNDFGKDEAIKRTTELSLIDKYKKDFEKALQLIVTSK